LEEVYSEFKPPPDASDWATSESWNEKIDQDFEFEDEDEDPE
jgi:hypothetical protein